ncbi:MAG: hypothetical protein HUU46_18930 [Candidatus Hydrogenedentes bacterium]|nr:hypothetical protein [Candidatus Hydrogenedentota bacterium]
MRGFVLALALVIPSLHTQAYVGVSTLHEVVDNSDAIYVAKVVEIIEYKSYKIAKARVSDILKGPHYEFAFFRAVSTWTCDISSAELGEDVVLVLNDNVDRTIVDSDKYTRATFDGVSELEARRLSETHVPLALTNNERFYDLAFFGRGYIPIYRYNGARRVEVFGDLYLPDDLKLKRSKLGRGYQCADLHDFLVVVKDAIARPDTTNMRYAWFREASKRTEDAHKERALGKSSTLRHGR